MSRHTPGKWNLRRAKYDRNVDVVVTNPVGSDSLVASAYPGPGDDRAEANARLIAAAPALLDALKDVFALINEGFLVRDTSKDSDPLWALNSLRFVTRLKEAHAAIAKAEGT